MRNDDLSGTTPVLLWHGADDGWFLHVRGKRRCRTYPVPYPRQREPDGKRSSHHPVYSLFLPPSPCSCLSTEKSSMPWSTSANSPMTAAESAFQRLRTVFSSYSVGGMKKKEHNGHSSLTNDTRSFIMATTCTIRSIGSSMPLPTTTGANNLAISSGDLRNTYSWLNQIPFW